MQENTNRAIAYNSIILYGKTAINTICALLTTRFALQALGVVDYGLYAVLGGIVSFISIFNTIMLSSSNRFIAVALGKGDKVEINKQFNVNLVIHLFIALLAFGVAYPVGEWYIPRYVNYDGPLSKAMMVYVISITASIISFISVPYNGLLMAKEKFIVFSLMDVASHLIRMTVAFLLLFYFSQKLLVYTLTMAVMTALPTVVYYIYCNRRYYDIVRIRLVRDRGMYKSVLKFSAWVSVGAFAYIAKSQGAALIVNTFFNTVMNTAMGVASSINAYVGIFANNVVQPMQPQITKSFAVCDTKRTDELLVMSTKYAFMLTLMVGSIFLIAPEWLLGIWLGIVPPYASVFLTLFVIDHLVQSLNSGIGNIIWASGKIMLYQVLTSLLNIFAVLTGYYVLRGGAPAYYLVVIYICFSVIRFFAIQWSLHHTLHYDNSKLWKKSYLPSILVFVLYLFVFFIPKTIHPFGILIISQVYLSVLVWMVGLSKTERKQIIIFIQNKINYNNNGNRYL